MPLSFAAVNAEIRFPLPFKVLRGAALEGSLFCDVIACKGLPARQRRSSQQPPTPESSIPAGLQQQDRAPLPQHFEAGSTLVPLAEPASPPSASVAQDKSIAVDVSDAADARITSDGPAATAATGVRGGSGFKPADSSGRAHTHSSTAHSRRKMSLRTGQGVGLTIGGAIKLDIGIGRDGIQEVHLGLVDPFF